MYLWYNRIMKFIKKNKWALLASFFIPLILMVIVLAMTGIYWGSSRSILAGDAYHQYVAIHSLYRNILHSGGFKVSYILLQVDLVLIFMHFRLIIWEVFSCRSLFSLM